MAGWRRSGQAARAYAAQVGVSLASLHRWSSASRRGKIARLPRLVEVVPSDVDGASWAWELELPGSRLRGRTALDVTIAKIIVEALVRGGRR